MATAHDIQQLLARAVESATDVVRARLGREVQVVPAEQAGDAPLLRFDLNFVGGASLSWLVSNEDATGFSDMLIGGQGDRTAVLTEMHLDGLSAVFSDMLERTVEGVSMQLDSPLTAGGVDMGMEDTEPPPPINGQMFVLALEIHGFGPLRIVQVMNEAMCRHLGDHMIADAAASQTAPQVDEPVTSAGPAPVVPGAPQPADSAAADNVVAMPARAAEPAAPQVAATGERDLNMLMNVPLPLTVELGQAHRTIKDLVGMSVGSIIELSKLAGDPLDIKVNDRVIARGEVVVIDEEFGIRVTEITSPEERLRNLGT